MIKHAIIGTGGMARAHVKSFQKIPGVKVVACCDIDPVRVTTFAKEFDIPETFTSTDELLRSTQLDSISNVTPDPFHKDISIQALNAGKHVLCEKPLALNAKDAQEMVEAAQKAGTINMVNFSYRNSAALIKAHDLVQSGVLGNIRHVEAQYLQSWLSSTGWGDWKTSPKWLWRLSSKHGSKGVLGDVGVHILDFASFPVAPISSVHCKLKTFDKAPGNQIDEYVLDANDSAMITVEFANGALGSITSTRYATGHANSLLMGIYGDEGSLRIDLDRSYDELDVCLGENRHTFKWETMTCDKTPSIYQRFITSIQTGEQDQPDFARGAEIQQILDTCFESDALTKTLPVPQAEIHQ